jgi:hypothetical protein
LVVFVNELHRFAGKYGAVGGGFEALIERRNFPLACRRKTANLSAMQWYYANGDQPLGPVPEEEFQALAKAGAIGPATMVWHEGMAAWALYSAINPGVAVPPMAVVAPPVITNQAQCAECLRWFAFDDVIKYENVHVCAQCKPRFFQKIAEGVQYAGAGGGWAWRKGNLLVMAIGAELPDRCVKCNRPADGFKLQRKLYWHPTWVVLMLCLNIIVYVVVAMVTRRKAVVFIPLCAEHQAARTRNRWVCGGSLVAMAASLALAIGVGNGWLSLLVLGFLVAGMVFGMIAQTVGARFIDAQYVHISGVKHEFLTSLPEWRGP